MVERKNKTRIDAKVAANIERLFEENTSTKDIAKLVDLSQRSVQNYIKLHISEEIGNKWIPFDSTPIKRANKPLKDQRKEAVINILRRDAPLTKQQVIDQLKEQNLGCCKRTLDIYFKECDQARKRLRQIPIERNSATTIDKRHEYASAIRFKMDKDLYFLYETGFNLHAGPSFGYAVKGTTPTPERPGNRGQNMSLLVCIGITGVKNCTVIDGAYNTDSFITFMNELCPWLPRNANIVMDNVAFHKSQRVKDAMKNFGYTPRYLPPYSPQLNPIEEFFAMVKARQARIRPRPRARYELRHKIENTINELIGADLRPFYDHIRQYVEIAIDRNPFDE